MRSIGGAESYASVTLADLDIDIGGLPVVLRPAHILLNRSQRSYIGNFGMDLWKQGRAFKLDFTAMTLQLERSE